jgi:uncharacterized protein YbjT (DUF2867 family)
MILVTGAAGKTGRAVIKHLAGRGLQVRAFVHREEQSQVAISSGATEVLVGDMLDEVVFDQAVKDIGAIYHVCPNVSPNELEIGRMAISKSRAHRVERFVYHSVLHPQTKDMPHHWAKLQVEELLLGSSLSYTILQPAAYMQNILGNWDLIVEKGIFQIPYPVGTRISMVDLQDVAEVAAKVILDRKHTGATYELVGPEALSQEEVAKAISTELGIEVQARQESLQNWEARMKEGGMGGYKIRTLVKMFEYYALYGFQGSPVVLQHLLQREPTDFPTFLHRWVNSTSGIR